eukprot:6687487-Alexandrium_andersonii.AAC.1
MPARRSAVTARHQRRHVRSRAGDFARQKGRNPAGRRSRRSRLRGRGLLQRHPRVKPRPGRL